MKDKYRELYEMWDCEWNDPQYNPNWALNEINYNLINQIKEIKFHKNSTLLDVGCGDGFISKYFADNGINVTAIDYASGAINRAIIENNHPNIQYLCDDICYPKFAYNQFDVVFDRGCLHVLPLTIWKKYFDSIDKITKSESKYVLLFAVIKEENPDKNEFKYFADVIRKNIEQLTKDNFVTKEFNYIEINPGSITRPGNGFSMIMIKK